MSFWFNSDRCRSGIVEGWWCMMWCYRWQLNTILAWSYIRYYPTINRAEKYNNCLLSYFGSSRCGMVGIDCCFLLLDEDYCWAPKQWSRLWGIGGSGGQFDFITIRGISAVLFRNTLLHNSRDSSHEERGWTNESNCILKQEGRHK